MTKKTTLNPALAQARKIAGELGVTTFIDDQVNDLLGQNRFCLDTTAIL